MAGKKMLDLAALFYASRGAARKHFALRSQHVEIWSQTSSIAKALKSQADRVTERVKIKTLLLSHLTNSLEQWLSKTPESPKKSSVDWWKETGTKQQPTSKLGSEQLYRREEPEPNESQRIVELEEPRLEADSWPLPNNKPVDLDANVNTSKQHQDLVSDRPATLQRDGVSETGNGDNGLRSSHSIGLSKLFNSKILRTPSSTHARMLYEFQIPSLPADAESGRFSINLAEGHDEDILYKPSQQFSPQKKIPRQTENAQDNYGRVPPAGLNPDCFTVTGNETISGTQAAQEQEKVPEGVDTELFYSPRIARMLGSQAQVGAPDKMSPEAYTRLSSGKADTFPDSEYVMKLYSEGTKREGSAEDFSKEGDKERAQTAHISSPTTSLATPYEMRESRVPSSRAGRLWNYGGLVAGLFGGAVSESLRRATGNGGEGSYMLGAANMNRLVGKLSKMRGAALKLGQMMSFQDSKMLPASIHEILLRVQDSADYMPPSQRNKVLASNLGSDWRGLFSSFDEKPIAAASIGQVHSAILRSTGEKVAVKVQYPGVADSIDSDLSNLSILLTASRLLPRGLYLEKTISNARTELAWECDYIREAKCAQRFRDLLSAEKDIFVVPKIISEASGRQVLTMEYMKGIGITKVENLKQDQSDWIGTQILRLCLREITEFKFMQTDPNWTNFLYNEATHKLELVDFGASRDYPDDFISQYTRLLLAASKSDKEAVRNLSIRLGYLTGHESKAMLDAHTASILTLAEPFTTSSPGVYDFRDQTITERVKALIPVMIRERLAPPPEETYSLHRKLSGAFLLCARLGSRVRCRELFENSMKMVGLF